jgi:hypothetical protein
MLAALLLAGSEIATIAAVLVTASRDVYQRAQESLRVGSTVLDEFMQSRSRALRTTVRVLASDYGFKEAVATNDLDTIRSALENHGRRADADVTLLIQPDGHLLASTLAEQSTAGDDDYAHVIARAEQDDDATPATLTIDGHAYQMITVPLRAPVTVAWVSMGFSINDELAEKLKSLTSLEVTFVTPNGKSARRILGSTLAPEERRHLEDNAAGPPLSGPDQHRQSATTSRSSATLRPGQNGRCCCRSHCKGDGALFLRLRSLRSAASRSWRRSSARRSCRGGSRARSSTSPRRRGA